MPKIILSGYIHVPSDELEKILEALPTHIALTKQEAGCLKFEVSQKPGVPNQFDVYEEFESKEAFERHQMRVRESNWGAVSVNVNREYSIREVDE